MSAELTRTDETRDAVNRIAGVVDVALAMITGTPMIRLTTNLSGKEASTYVAYDRAVADAVLSAVNSPWLEQMADADAMEHLVAEAEATEGIEDVSLHPVKDGYLPIVSMVAAGIGLVKFEVVATNPDWTLAKALRRLRRTRTQDAEGRTLSRLGAMSVALVARDAADVDDLLDTLFTAGTIIYRGFDCQAQPNGRLITCLQMGTTRIRSDSIGMANLPDTIKTSVRGNAYRDRPLSDLVEVAGFEQLRIAKIDARPRATRLTAPGAGWIYIDVRDTLGATLDELEREEARAVAQETFERRRIALGAKD